MAGMASAAELEDKLVHIVNHGMDALADALQNKGAEGKQLAPSKPNKSKKQKGRDCEKPAMQASPSKQSVGQTPNPHMAQKHGESGKEALLGSKKKTRRGKRGRIHSFDVLYGEQRSENTVLENATVPLSDLILYPDKTGICEAEKIFGLLNSISKTGHNSNQSGSLRSCPTNPVRCSPGLDMPVRQDTAVSLGANKKKAATGDQKILKKTKVSDAPPKATDTQASSSKPTKLGPVNAVLKGDPNVSEEVLEELRNDFLFPLKKRSNRFPNARFYCQLCEYHCDTVVISRNHCKDTRHVRLKQIRSTDILLKNLPAPCESHELVLSKVVERLYSEQSTKEETMMEITNVIETVSEIIQETIPDVELVLYGSRATGFAILRSDVNIDVNTEKCSEIAPRIFAQIAALIRQDDTGYFTTFSSDFAAKVPSLSFTVLDSDLVYKMTINSQTSCQTTRLLRLYAKMDWRMKKLAVAFRYWAMLCDVDQQERGTLPAYVYSLMTVYFLQHCQQPVLPVVHELSDKLKKAEQNGTNKNKVIPPVVCEEFFKDVEKISETWKSENTQSLGDLWFHLLRFYAVQHNVATTIIAICQLADLSREEKKWTSKKLAIEDPFAKRRNVASSVSHSHVYEYIYDRLRAAFHYFGVPQTTSGPVFTKVDSNKLQRQMCKEYILKNDKKNKEDEGQGKEEHKVKATTLVMRAQCLASHTSSHVDLSNKTNQAQHSVSCEKLEESSKLAEDELRTVLPKDEKSQDNSHNIKAAEKVKGIAHGSSGTDQSQITSIVKSTTSHSQSLCSGSSNSIDTIAESITTQVLSSSMDRVKELQTQGDNVSVIKTEANHLEQLFANITFRDSEDTMSGATPTVTAANEECVITKLFKQLTPQTSGEQSDSEKITNGGSKMDDEATEDSSSSMTDSGFFDYDVITKLTPDDLVFQFDETTLADGKGPALMCSLCHAEGHLKGACPEEHLPPPEALPPLTNNYIRALDDALWQVLGDFEPSNHEIRKRQRVLQELEDFIQDEYPDAELRLFGSSCNGFGFTHSDLDICMSGYESEEYDCVEIIKNMAKMFRKNRGVYNVIPITTAKVPIVKFKHRMSQLECDISLNNSLAQHNTSMLLMYSEIDTRVKALGYVMKVFAKVCDICDASRGSLSSYAYILVVIYFLQQRKPPVIPVLQELHKGKKPELIVEGCNAWYYNDMKSLPKVWSGFNRNNETLAELWVGLLRFYMEEFQFQEHVICIRQLEPLTRFEKLWNGKCIAIEDPFDLNHNLGAGISRKMNMFIMKAFRRGRVRFGRPFHDFPHMYGTLQNYLFDPSKLTDGNLPNDRGCRVCGKIGHFAKECPRVVARKQRSEDDGGQQQRAQNRAGAQASQNTTPNRGQKGSRPQPIPAQPGSYRGHQNTPTQSHSPGRPGLMGGGYHDQTPPYHGGSPQGPAAGSPRGHKTESIHSTPVSDGEHLSWQQEQLLGRSPPYGSVMGSPPSQIQQGFSLANSYPPALLQQQQQAVQAWQQAYGMMGTGPQQAFLRNMSWTPGSTQPLLVPMPMGVAPQWGYVPTLEQLKVQHDQMAAALAMAQNSYQVASSEAGMRTTEGYVGSPVYTSAQRPAYDSQMQQKYERLKHDMDD